MERAVRVEMAVETGADLGEERELPFESNFRNETERPDAYREVKVGEPCTRNDTPRVK